MHTRRRIPQLWTALVAGAAGVVLFAVPAQAQVDLTGPTGTDPVEQTVEGAGDEVSTTVTTLVEAVEETVDETVEPVEEIADDGVVVELPGASVEVDAPDLLTDPVGSLDGLVDDAAPGPSSVSGTDTRHDPASESARADDEHPEGPRAGDETTTVDGPLKGQGGVVPGVVATRSRPFVLTARDVGTFGLPLVVAGLLCAYLGMDSWMRRREPATVPVVEDRDELLRFE